MRIATRLWLALVVATTLVLAGGLMLRLREEQRLMLDLTLRDRRFFAEALHAAIARENSDGDPLGEARAMLDREEVAAAHIVARLVSLDGSQGLARPNLDPEHRRILQSGDVVVAVHGEEILTYVPVGWGVSTVAIELREPSALSALVARLGMRSLVVQATALALLGGLVTFALVGLLIGRPLQRLSGLTRRIALGDLEGRVPVPLSSRDEVSMLAHDMNSMADALKTTRIALEESDAERAAALERLRHADRLRTVGELASALAHELGTPLNVVSGHARSIEEDPAIGAETRASAQQILDQTRRMTGIIRTLLDYSRRKGRRGDHPLKGVVERAAEALSPLARRNRVVMSIEGDPDITVQADAQQLLQVVSNLVTNAMQAMPDGGQVVLRVGRIVTTPPVGFPGTTGPYVYIEVEDEGVGIAEDDLKHLFEPFFTRKEEGEGTGLGLAVVEGIVREHGGFVEVHSRAPGGTRIRVNLPASPRPSSVPPPV